MSRDYDRGLKVRRGLLGDTFVSRVTGDVPDLMQPLQAPRAQARSSGIWTRTGLVQRERGLDNFAMPTAPNRSDELRLHERGARSDAVARKQIGEVLLQCRGDCGLPEAIASFKAAEHVFAEHEAEHA